MFIEERYETILQLVNQQGSVKNQNLAEKLKVSLETIRRDLDHLEQEGLLVKVHGGAISKHKMKNKYPNLTYKDRETFSQEEKAQVAKLACEYVKDNDIIMLNSGTTNFLLAKNLLHRFRKLTVITNSQDIASMLMEDDGITVILAGGIYNRQEKGFLGGLTAEFLNHFKADKLFLSVSGVDYVFGLSDYNDNEVLVQQKMIANSAQIIVLADSKKLESISLLHVCNISEVDMIITDDKVPNETLKKYKSLKINIKSNKTT